MNYNDILFYSCADNNSNQVKRIFDLYNEKTDKVDVLYSDGQLFRIAISNNNFEICEALLSFFEIKQNTTIEQREELHNVLKEITSFSDISTEMKKILSPYIDFEDGSSDRGLDSEVGNAPEGIPSDNDMPSQVGHAEASTLASLTEENLKKHGNKYGSEVMSIEERIEGLFIENTSDKKMDDCDSLIDNDATTHHGNTSAYHGDTLLHGLLSCADDNSEQTIAYRKETIGDVHHDDSHI